jgi:hypothetical protein
VTSNAGGGGIYPPVLGTSSAGVVDAYWWQSGLLPPGSATPDPAWNMGTARSATANTWSAPELVGALTGDSGTVFLDKVRVCGLPSGTACLFERASLAQTRLVHLQRIGGTMTTTVLAASTQVDPFYRSCLRSDSAGRQAVAWVESGVLRLRLLLAGASTWSAPVDVASGAYEIDVAFGSNGRVLVAWTEASGPTAFVRARTYDSATGTLGSAATLNAALAGAAARGPGLAVGPHGDEFVVCWAQSRPVPGPDVVTVVHASVGGTTTWSAPATLGTMDPRALRLLALPAGGALALFDSAFGIYARELAKGAWSTLLRVARPGSNFGIEGFEAAVRSNGDVLIVWVASGPGRQAYGAVRLPDGAVTTPAPLSDLITNVLGLTTPSLCIAANGVIAVGWLQQLSLGAGTSTAANYVRMFRP